MIAYNYFFYVRNTGILNRSLIRPVEGKEAEGALPYKKQDKKKTVYRSVLRSLTSSTVSVCLYPRAPMAHHLSASSAVCAHSITGRLLFAARLHKLSGRNCTHRASRKRKPLSGLIMHRLTCMDWLDQ